MLSHQIEFSQAIAEIYKPISGRVSDPDSIVSEGNPEGIRACEEYEAIVKELQVTLEPELEMIDSRIIKPADELITIIKQIRKCVVKREHKQLDYDRHRATLKKLQDKKDKSMKDEKAMYKAENELEQATQEFNYFNDLLKDELPKLFHLEREFIRPLFQSFYYMQLNVFYTLHERMQGCDIGYFNLTLGIEEAFEAKRGEIQVAAEALSITKFKTTGARRNPKYGPGAAAGRLGIESGTSRLAISDKPAYGSTSAPSTATHPPPTWGGASAYQKPVAAAGYGQNATTDEVPPPAYISHPAPQYELDTKSSVGRANSTGSNWGAIAKSKGAAPPPPKPKPARFSGVPMAETATGLYDYEAQAEGDLSFTTGEVIEIVSRTQNENEWWVGKIRGKEGQFPGMSDFPSTQGLGCVLEVRMNGRDRKKRIVTILVCVGAENRLKPKRLDATLVVSEAATPGLVIAASKHDARCASKILLLNVPSSRSDQMRLSTLPALRMRLPGRCRVPISRPTTSLSNHLASYIADCPYAVSNTVR